MRVRKTEEDDEVLPCHSPHSGCSGSESAFCCGCTPAMDQRVTPIRCYLLFIHNCSGAVFQRELFERGLCRFDNSAQCSLLGEGLESKPRGKGDAKLISTVAHQGGNRHHIHNHTTVTRIGIAMELLQTWN